MVVCIKKNMIMPAKENNFKLVSKQDIHKLIILQHPNELSA